MKSFIWKYNDKNIQQISDKFVFLLCLYCAKRKPRFRSKIFEKYKNFYKDSNILQSSLTSKEPYKSILQNLDSKKVSSKFQIQLLEDFKNFAIQPENNNIHLFCVFSILCFFLLILTLGFSFHYLAHYLKTKSFNDFPLISITLLIFSLLGIFVFSKKLLAQIYPRKFINEYLNNNFSDKVCLNFIEELCKEIDNQSTNTFSQVVMIQNNIIKNKQETNINIPTQKEKNTEKDECKKIATKTRQKKKEQYKKLSQKELIQLFYQKYTGVQKNFLEVLRKHKYNGKMTLASDYSLLDNCILLITYLYDKTPESDYPLLETLFNKENLSAYKNPDYNKELLKSFENFLSLYK